jgi:dUTP pyrophosphatase
MSTELYLDRRISLLEDRIRDLESRSYFPGISQSVVRLIKDHPNAVIPTKAHEEGDACYDLYSIEEFWLQPGRRQLVDTGWRIALAPHWEGQVRPRSGLACTKGVTVLNSPGTIDSNFRGNIKALLINLGSMPIQVFIGDRIAQLRLSKVPVVTLEVVTVFDETPRNTSGWGSSGK